jgi:RND family efflux transporter MFP subunit
MEQTTLPMPPARKRRDEINEPTHSDEKQGGQPNHEQQDAGSHQQGGHDDLPPIDSLPRPGRKFFWVALIVVLLIIGGAFAFGILPKLMLTKELDTEAADRLNAAPAVSVALPRQSKAATELQLPGSAQPLQETSLFARTTGYLKKWNFDYGAAVKKDDVLAVIDSPDVDQQLREALASLQSDAANVSKAELDLTYTDTTARRYDALLKGNSVTPQELDMYHANLAKARTTVAVAKATLAADEANVKRLETLQSFEQVIAPFSGTITARNYDAGALITANGVAGVMPMFRLAETDVLRVWVNVPQSYASDIKVHMKAQISVRELPGKKFTGIVKHTAGALDPVSRTLATEVQIPNSDGKLFSGAYCQVYFELHNPAPPLIVPVSALISNAQGNQVAVVGDDMIAHYKQVDLGRDYGTDVEIANGLEPTDKIITNPGERLGEGVKVRIVADKEEAK